MAESESEINNQQLWLRLKGELIKWKILTI